MALTKQQATVISTIQRDDVSLVKVEAVAGAGKTHTLVELAKALKPSNGIYLAYNKAIAQEASEKFIGTKMKCSTIHSMAYQAVVRSYGLKVGFFGVRDVEPKSLPYNTKRKVVAVMDELLLSKYTHIQDFFDEKHGPEAISQGIQDIIMDHLDKMTNGKITCSHSFYLKLYHILLANGELEAPEADLLMIDEAGDLTPISLDIFNIIKAPKKVMVGDAMQNIYSFNNTINGFTALKDVGVSVPLTQSFRVSTEIASRIEGFCKEHIDEDMEFKGRTYVDETVYSKAYIARTNSGLVEEMFGLMSEGTAFNVTRSIDTILELPLVLANLGNGKPITNFKYKAVEKLRKEWENNRGLHSTYKTASSYVRTSMSSDEEIKSGFDVVFKHGTPDLNNLASYVRANAGQNHFLTLTTAHSCKGLEFSSVDIADDLNEALSKAFVKLEAATAKGDMKAIDLHSEELRLYYVAVSRAMVELTNAKHLSRGIIVN